MTFLSKRYQDYLDGLFKERMIGNTCIIPIGLNILMIDKCVIKKAKTGTPYLMMDLIKQSEKSYRSIRMFYWGDYDNKDKCNTNGIPYGILGLEMFLDKAFGYKLIHYNDDQLVWILKQIRKLKRKPFKAIISHFPKLYYKEDKLVLGRSDNLPMITYEPQITEYTNMDNQEFGKDLNYLKLGYKLIPEEEKIYQRYLILKKNAKE